MSKKPVFKRMLERINEKANKSSNDFNALIVKKETVVNQASIQLPHLYLVETEQDLWQILGRVTRSSYACA